VAHERNKGCLGPLLRLRRGRNLCSGQRWVSFEKNLGKIWQMKLSDCEAERERAQSRERRLRQSMGGACEVAAALRPSACPSLRRWRQIFVSSRPQQIKQWAFCAQKAARLHGDCKAAKKPLDCKKTAERLEGPQKGLSHKPI